MNTLAALIAQHLTPVRPVKTYRPRVVANTRKIQGLLRPLQDKVRKYEEDLAEQAQLIDALKE